MAEQNRFELSIRVEHYLAALSKLYARDQESQKLNIIVNAQIRVHEAWTSNDWNGGTFGHALYLTVPEAIYLETVQLREEIQNSIQRDLNKIHNVPDEFFAEVFLEIEPIKDRDWRRESGALQQRPRTISPEATSRVWAESAYRVFLSHKNEVKREAAKLKDDLALFGVSSFVAHEDIYPTNEWQDEIENALASMDAFVALLTDKFHDSLWTDQEVGYALGRGVPLIAVKLGSDPYGFIGKFQALSCSWEQAPLNLTRILLKQPRMIDAYLVAIERCSRYEHGNTISAALSAVGSLRDDQVTRLISAFNGNDQLQGSYGFSGVWPSKFGPGLAAQLSRLTGKPFVVGSSGKIGMKSVG